MSGREAAQRVSAAALAVGRHAADDGLQVLLLLQAGGVGLTGNWTKTRQPVTAFLKDKDETAATSVDFLVTRKDGPQHHQQFDLDSNQN